MSFKSCKDCVAPKRYPGCHATCPEYIAEKAAYDARKTVDDKMRYVRQGLIEQRNRVVGRAMRGNSKMKEGRNENC